MNLSLNRRKSFLKTCNTAEEGEGDRKIKVKQSNSATRFFGRLRTKVFGRPLSITLEGDNTSDSTTVAPSKLISHNPSSVQEAGGDSPRGFRLDDNSLQGGEPAPVGYKCHLCNFIADRITLLDRHLLDDHKLGLDNLLKLVMAKTMARGNSPNRCSKNLAFYQLSEINVDLDAVSMFERIRNSQPKEYKTIGTNTVDRNWGMSLKDNCNEINKQLENLLSAPLEEYDQGSLLTKMASLNELMCHVMESTNNLNLDIGHDPLKPLEPKSAARQILDLSIDDYLASPLTTSL